MPKNDTIFRRLKKATPVEIEEICKSLRLKVPATADEISKGYRRAAGHELPNIFREAHELPYRRILVDVADKLKPGLMWSDFTMTSRHPNMKIEDSILEFIAKRVDEELARIPPAERMAKARAV